MLWPQLELSLQKDFAYAVLREDLTRRQMMGEGDYCIRKKKGAVPHDVGAPCEEPWEFCNAYNFQDVSRWKDLGSKFILQIYRNYYYLTQILPSTSQAGASSELTDQNLRKYGGQRKHEQLLLQYLKELYPVLITVMQSMEKQFDTDNDGMIENSGFPDQTYDIWIAEGVHAYCGGLWISACEAIGRIAGLVDDGAHQEYYHNLAEKGRKVYLKELWNGVYLNYDNSQSSHHDSIMADMLAGQWYARACQLPPPISAGHAFSCLKTIYENNVIAFGKGQLLGAVNGMRPDKEMADQSCLQSQEVWTGTTYGLAAAMLQEAFNFPEDGGDDVSLGGAIGSNILSIEQRKELVKMAYITAKGIHDAGWQKLGYWFATPEAWGSTGGYRSLGYMRPLSIWAMQYARVQSEAIVSKLKQSQ